METDKRVTTMEGYKIYRNGFAEIRRRVKLMNISECDMLEQACKDNPQSTRSEMEKLIHRIYHPSTSDLEEERLLSME